MAAFKFQFHFLCIAYCTQHCCFTVDVFVRPLPDLATVATIVLSFIRGIAEIDVIAITKLVDCKMDSVEKQPIISGILNAQTQIRSNIIWIQLKIQEKMGEYHGK